MVVFFDITINKYICFIYFKRYNVTIIRKAFPRLSVFQSTTEELNFQDSISLSPIHCAFKINKTGYSLNFIDFFQKIASSDLLNEISLSIEENQYAAKTVLFNYIDFEESISNTMVHSPLLNGGNIFTFIFKSSR